MLRTDHRYIAALLPPAIDEFAMIQRAGSVSRAGVATVWPHSVDELSTAAANAVETVRARSTMDINIPTPSSSSNLALGLAGAAMGRLSLSPKEKVRTAVTEASFQHRDENGDGYLDRHELEKLAASGVLSTSPAPGPSSLLRGSSESGTPTRTPYTAPPVRFDMQQSINSAHLTALETQLAEVKSQLSMLASNFDFVSDSKAGSHKLLEMRRLRQRVLGAFPDNP